VIIAGWYNGIHNVAVRDAIFVYVPAGQHGRAFSLYSLVTRVAAVFGYFSGGLAGDQNAQSVYLLSGFLALAFGSLGLATMGRILDQKHTAS
jgi:MFS-type transporter involved in bile tolerance (Atg22 family)